MGIKNIIIAGYPKSGTTWASRLVAELLHCPLIGDWGFDHLDSEFKEGEDRDSDFRCYKSHHTFEELEQAAPHAIYQIIYIVRDPRDIALSGMHHFNFQNPRLNRLKKIMGSCVANFIFQPLSENQKKQKMIQAIFYGDKNLNQWLKIPWDVHYKTYQFKEVLFIKYEDLLNTPERICESIGKRLDMTFGKEHIINCIKNQSFRVKKEHLIADNHPTKNLLRKGEQGQWKNEFSKEEKALFKNRFSESSKLYKF